VGAEIEALFQDIGNCILDIVGDSQSKALAYAEVSDGVVSVDVFYIPKNSEIPIFKFGGKLLSDLFYALWSERSREDEIQQWRSACCVIQDGKQRIEFVYADKFDEGVGKMKRRAEILRKHFGSIKVDYSQS
jgi:hypothetical protein